MKTFVTLVYSLFLLQNAITQPTITRDWIGQPGDIIGTVESSIIPDASPSGPDAVWNFTGVNQVDSTLFIQRFVEADTTPFVNNYDGANTCLAAYTIDPEVGPVNAYEYSSLTDTEWSVLGTAISAEGASLSQDYSDPLLLLAFPFTYGSTVSDDYAGLLDLQIIQAYFSGTNNIEADAYGNVILPGGVFTNCLRLKNEQTRRDSTSFFGIINVIETIGTTYIWFSPDHSGPLAIHQSEESISITISPPLPPDTADAEFVTRFSWDPTAFSTSTNEVNRDVTDASAYPNPFASEVNLNFTLDRSRKVQFRLFTAYGELVESRDLQGARGVNSVTLETSHLPPAEYIGVLQGDGQVVTLPMIKVR